jgi:hypothetical protein
MQMFLPTMKDLLEMIDHGYQTEDALDNHAIITLTPLTNRPLGVNAPVLSKTTIGQDLSLVSPQITNIAEILVVDLGTIPAPINYLALWGNQPAQFHPHNPTMIGNTFLADLGWAATLPNGMNQFNSVAIDDAFGCGFNQEMVGQVRVVGQQALQAGTFRQTRKQVKPITCQPTIESPKMDPFEAEKDTDGNNLAGMQVGILALVDVFEFVVYHTKEPNNNFFGSHRFVLLLAFRFVYNAIRIEQTFSFYKVRRYSFTK